MTLKLALLDMAATTVDDTIDGCPLVLQSFADSFRLAGITLPWEVLNAQRGKDKVEVFRSLLASEKGVAGEALAQMTQHLLTHFTEQLLRNVSRLREMPGATTALQRLKQHGLFIALGSGFPLPVTQAIAQHLGWRSAGLVDYVTCGEAAGGGRPQPHMLHCAMQAAGLLPADSPIEHALPGIDYGQMLKVGDTVQDVAEGLQVGALTLAVTSGTQSAATLAKAGPAAVLPSIAEVPGWLQEHGYLG